MPHSRRCTPSVRVLGVFNAFDTPNPGGVQASARIAWQAMRAPDSGFDARAFLVSLEPLTQTPADPAVSLGVGRLGAIAAARRVGPADLVLFWHLDLLKLTPLLRLGSSCKRVLFLHGTESWRPRGWLTRRALGSIDVVFSNTSFTLRHAIKANPEIGAIPARVVPLGIGQPLDELPAAPAAVPAAIMIARLDAAERYKGHEEVMAAWPLVQQRVPDAQLWIVGDGDLKSELEQDAIRSGSADHVRFFGRVSEPEKDALLRQARCLLLPSTGEGFGLVYLEAMRLGRACLVGPDGGREVINAPEAGLAVTHRQPQEIADAVVRLLTMNDDWHRRSRNAKLRYEGAYTAAHFGTRINQALREAAR